MTEDRHIEGMVDQQTDNCAPSTMPRPSGPQPPGSNPRYFERAQPGERPLSLFETMAIVLSTHLGVRTAKKREEDFRRANGLHLFIAGVFYFLLIVVGLVILVNIVTR